MRAEAARVATTSAANPRDFLETMAHLRSTYPSCGEARGRGIAPGTAGWIRRCHADGLGGWDGTTEVGCVCGPCERRGPRRWPWVCPDCGTMRDAAWGRRAASVRRDAFGHWVDARASG